MKKFILLTVWVFTILSNNLYAEEINCKTEMKKMEETLISVSFEKIEKDPKKDKYITVSKTTAATICGETDSHFLKVFNFPGTFKFFVKESYPNKIDGYKDEIVKELFDIFDKEYSEQSAKDFFEEVKEVTQNPEYKNKTVKEMMAQLSIIFKRI